MNDIFDNDRSAATNDFGVTPKDSNVTGHSGIVTALFKDRASAEKAYNALRERGYAENEINVLLSNEGRDKHFAGDTAPVAETELGSKALEGAGTGSAIGGTVGAIVAAIAAIGTSVVLPGLGLIVAGPIAAALAGAGAGGLTGGLIGALIGSGIPEERAKVYESGIQAGGIVIGVNPHTAEDRAFIENEFRAAGGESVYS